MATQEQLKREILNWQAEIEEHRKKVKAKKEVEMPMYTAYLELAIKVNQREIARLNKALTGN